MMRLGEIISFEENMVRALRKNLVQGGKGYFENIKKWGDLEMKVLGEDGGNGNWLLV